MSTSSRVGDHVLSLSTGEMVGERYQTEALIGQGGMGAVFRARDLRTGRSVALKILYAEYAADAGWRRRFMREARAAAAIGHPNIVDVLDVDVEGPVPYLAMELLEGETLGQLLTRERTLSLGAAAAYLIPVCAAVHAGHQAGIVHRDLKPENVFLAVRDERRVPYVLDFGIAKVSPLGMPNDTAGAPTQTGAVLGTPHFMSPEQMLNDEEVDARADVWALGVVLFFMLTGERPYAGFNLAQILKSVLTSTHTRLDELRPDLPADVVELVHACLAPKKQARPTGVDQLAAVLAPHVGVTSPAPRQHVGTVPRVRTQHVAAPSYARLVIPESRESDESPRAPTVEALQGLRRTGSSQRFGQVLPASQSASHSTTRFARIVFGMVPQRDDDKTRILLTDLCAYLSKYLDVPVLPHRSPSQDALASALNAGRVHCAWTGALQLLLSAHMTQMVPIASAVREGVAFYHSVLFTPASTPIETLADAKGKRVAWVAPASASGYVVPRLSLARRGIDVDGFFSAEIFTGSHAQAARAVVLGEADVAGTYAIFEDGDPTRPLVKSGYRTFDPELEVRTLDVSGPIPSDLIVVAPKVPAEVKRGLSQAFLQIAEDAASKEIMTDLIGADAFTHFTQSILREVRALVDVAGARGATSG